MKVPPCIFLPRLYDLGAEFWSNFEQPERHLLFLLLVKKTNNQKTIKTQKLELKEKEWGLVQRGIQISGE